jgi:hypothetical protein
MLLPRRCLSDVANNALALSCKTSPVKILLTTPRGNSSIVIMFLLSLHSTEWYAVWSTGMHEREEVRKSGKSHTTQCVSVGRS